MEFAQVATTAGCLALGGQFCSEIELRIDILGCVGPGVWIRDSYKPQRACCNLPNVSSYLHRADSQDFICSKLLTKMHGTSTPCFCNTCAVPLDKTLKTVHARLSASFL